MYCNLGSAVHWLDRPNGWTLLIKVLGPSSSTWRTSTQMCIPQISNVYTQYILEVECKHKKNTLKKPLNAGKRYAVKLVWWWNAWLQPLSPLFNWIVSGFPTRQVLFPIQHTRFQRIFQLSLWVAVINFKLNLSALCSARGTGPQWRGCGRLSRWHTDPCVGSWLLQDFVCLRP